MSPTIRTAVFPVAGLGTRFLPASKAIPKEMLPVVDKPLIQYAVEEAVAAGAERLVFVTGRNKGALEDHFDHAVELEAELEARGKPELLERVREILPAGVQLLYTRQGRALGLGHAVLCARPMVGDEPFYVVLPDDLIRGDPEPCLVQMRAAYARSGRGNIAVMEVPGDQVSRYGIVATDAAGNLTDIVEKPDPAAAPSNLAVVGRYLLTPSIWDLLARTRRGAGGEIQLTDAIAAQLAVEPVQACQFRGRRFDCGSKLGFLEATVEYGMQHPEVGESFTKYLSNQ